MATKHTEPEDPMALVGVGLDEDPDDEALAEMAWAFVEEYARLGWSREQILGLFRNPFFRVPHHILEVKGEAFVSELVDTVEELRSRVRQEMERRQ